jgi:hypothetical protein
LVQTFGYSHNDPRPSLIYETKYDKRGNNQIGLCTIVGK